MTNNQTHHKAQLAGWLWEVSKELPFNSVFCPFSGSAAVARLFKEEGKEVITTDVLLTHAQAARALIENDDTILDAFDEEAVIAPNDRSVQRLEGMAAAYALPPEFGAWLDVCYTNIEQIDHDYKKSLAATVISLVINYILAFDETTRSKMAEDEWISAFHYYLTSVNSSVFSNGKTCLAHDRDANSLVKEIDTEALSFYLPFPMGVNDLRPAERFAELFNRHCFEKELDKSLAGLVSGLGAPFTDNDSYLAALESFLDSASSINKWLISASESSLPKPEVLNALISKFKKNVSMRGKKIFYSKNLSHTEYLFVARD
jgi:adenine-specific DNA-methyltransferase